MEIEEGDATILDDETEQKPGFSSEILGAQPGMGADVGDWFLERSKFIPLRLTLSERKFLRLLDAALLVSEYTDKIDTLGFGLSKPKRIVHQIRELCSILSGLVLSADYKQGQELFADRDFESNSDFYQMIFELGRRHKIMNPDKMRTTYGKLIYLLQVILFSGKSDIALTIHIRIVKRLKSESFLAFLASDLLKPCTLFLKNTEPPIFFGKRPSRWLRWRFIQKVVRVVTSKRTSKTRNAQ
jgi:hypothetical protein